MSFCKWKACRRSTTRATPALRGVSLDVRAGEILGIAGVAGNGQSELAECITGLRMCDGGTITVEGVDVATSRR